jgi:NAD(P)-dependent dehydrogenase (short-subunit alcohol dehydrogenase family)
MASRCPAKDVAVSVDETRQDGFPGRVNHLVSRTLGYTAAKAAVQGLTRSLARDLGPYGIRVNAIVDGGWT